MFSKETYQARRDELKKRVGSGLILFLGNDEVGMNYGANIYPFRQDSTFLYYFGLAYPGLNAIIDIDSNREIIFGDELTIDDIVWTGPQPTLREKAALVGVDTTCPSRDIITVLSAAMNSGQTIHHIPYYRGDHAVKIFNYLGIRPGAEKPSLDLIRAVVDMRNHKTEEEIAEIEKACMVTADMHIKAMEVTRPGMYEYEVVAALESVAAANNCRLSFPTIATIHGETLHNEEHSNLILDDSMLLVDAGAETPMGYAGDMSSTICAGKKFTDRQKSVYDIQVAAHLAAVEALRPGRRFEEVYDLASAVIFNGMKELGIARGDAEEAVKAGAHAMFFQCGLGHMMGLDVHDMENLGEQWVGYAGKPKSTQFGRKSLRLGRELEPGFVLTIEPGVYFIPELIDMWKAEKRFEQFINYAELEKWRDFGGIRNEEDYLITADGARRLGKKIPLTTQEVEALR